MPSPISHAPTCAVCRRVIPRSTQRRRYCSEECRLAKKAQDYRSLRVAYDTPETVRPEMQAARTTRIACLAALARLGLPLDLPLPADLLD